MDLHLAPSEEELANLDLHGFAADALADLVGNLDDPVPSSYEVEPERSHTSGGSGLTRVGAASAAIADIAPGVVDQSPGLRPELSASRVDPAWPGFQPSRNSRRME